MTGNQTSCDSVRCLFGELLRMIAGMSLLFVGGLMTITFWLLPLGVPLALLGVAVLVSGGQSSRAPTNTMPDTNRKRGMPSRGTIERLGIYVDKYLQKTGTSLHPDPGVSKAVVLGLAENIEQLGRPLCPCNFYPDKRAELAAGRDWVCACDEMKQYKYCKCLLFVTPDGLPITEHLSEDHEGRRIYGLVADPTPDKGRESKHHAAA